MRSWPFSIAAIAAIVAGCNRGPMLQRAWGTVTLKGQEIQSGTIEFTPIDGTTGSSAGSIIRNGRYEVPAAHGLLAGGKYKVVVVCMAKTGKIVEDFQNVDGKPLYEYANIIPSSFSGSSKLVVNVSGDEDNQFNLHLLPDGIDLKGAGGASGRIQYHE
jgi:hypothetical protein